MKRLATITDCQWTRGSAENHQIKTEGDTWVIPDDCEKKCPICTKAREGKRLARFVQAIEMLVTFGGCPHGRARQRKYGLVNEPLPTRENDLPQPPCPKA